MEGKYNLIATGLGVKWGCYQIWTAVSLATFQLFGSGYQRPLHIYLPVFDNSIHAANQLRPALLKRPRFLPLRISSLSAFHLHCNFHFPSPVTQPNQFFANRKAAALEATSHPQDGKKACHSAHYNRRWVTPLLQRDGSYPLPYYRLFEARSPNQICSGIPILVQPFSL